MPHLRILLAIIAGGLASPMIAAPLEASLRHQTPDAAMLAYGLAPVIVAVLALGGAALFGQEPEAGRVIRTSLHMDSRKVGDVITRHMAAPDSPPSGGSSGSRA